MKGPFWDKDSKIIVPLRVRNKHNTLYVENNPDEVRDGDYIRTSIGNGILQVCIICFRVMAYFLMSKKVNLKEIYIKNGEINF